jgi:hypothetical protein
MTQRRAARSCTAMASLLVRPREAPREWPSSISTRSQCTCMQQDDMRVDHCSVHAASTSVHACQLRCGGCDVAAMASLLH